MVLLRVLQSIEMGLCGVIVRAASEETLAEWQGRGIMIVSHAF